MQFNTKRFSIIFSAVLWATVFAGMSLYDPVLSTSAEENDKPVAPLLEGMGDLTHPVTTSSPAAQRFFDQGLVLAYGFNHAEASRSFQEAARLDPGCAMCYWGQALVLGPNINSMMDPTDIPAACDAMDKALALLDKASPREQDYIRALSARYSRQAEEDRSALDLAYAQAMGKLAAKYPEDVDAGALYAESLMDTSPWDYWQEDGSPKPVTRKILAELERVLEMDPDHPGALHYYIHAVEAQHPEKAEKVAERLEGRVPGAGHLVHMPSHIYIRVGRYIDAAEANKRAIEADDDYITACRKQGIYPLGYMPHNHHFLWASATLAGQGQTALDAARELAANQDAEMMGKPGMGTLQHYWVTPYFAQVRFGRWQDILAQPEPPFEYVFPKVIHRYARTLALTRSGRLEEAAGELEVLRRLSKHPELKTTTIWDINSMAPLAEIALEVAEGELAAAKGNHEEAIAHLRKGVEAEDSLRYNEPDDWHQPVRQVLGAVLLEAGKPAQAEQVYREDMKHYPENGWSLYGLYRALKAQGKDSQAAQVKERFEKAWASADVKLTASRF
ncbi:MAG TPA: hypothetical protein VLV83_21500 [Acidobacteriota bacterium]|nr:hypothetical protein [Acidobacteriota bacterium]